MKSFCIIIPTMWCSPLINEMLPMYCASKMVSKVIIIDNKPSDRPGNLFSHRKIILLPQVSNIFVNPAWNLGVSYTSQYPILANDDIQISGINILLDEILKLFNNKTYDLIGASVNNLDNWRGVVRTYNKLKGFPRRSFGCFMACRTYAYIPEQLKVYSGDVFQFDQAKKVGIIGSGFIYSPVSVTIRKYPEIKAAAISDAIAYRALKAAPDGLHIVVRTSGRPNYFKNCIASIRQYAPEAFLHITIDDQIDLAYVQEHCQGLNYNYYLINRKTVERLVSRFQFTRLPFIYNHYFNIVKPFLKGHVMFIDDDDMLVNYPKDTPLPASGFNLFRVRIADKLVPDDEHWQTVTLNYISTLSIMAWAHQLPQWNPQRGGDFDLIDTMIKQYPAHWHDKVVCATQTIGNKGKRNDLL